MNNIFDKLFGDFTIANFGLWIKELFLFFRHPFNTVRNISIRKDSEIFSQIFFYLILSNSFYFLVSKSDSNFRDILPLALDGLLGLIPILIIFSISSFLVVRNFRFKKLIIFFTIITCAYVPSQIVIYSNFIRFENYTFLYFSSILHSLFLLFICFVWAFAIEIKIKKALLMIVINLVFINIFQFIFFYIKIDPYAMDQSFEETDPIYQDYKSILDNLYSKEKYPVLFVYNGGQLLSDAKTGKDSIVLSAVGTLDGKSDKVITSPIITKNYMNDININLYNLRRLDSAVHFRRNRLIADKWYNQFYSIKNIVEEKSTKKYFLENINRMEFDSLRNFTSKEIYTPNIVELKNLEDYHTKIIQHHNNCTDLYNLGNLIISIPAYSVDNLIDLINPSKAKEDKVRFNFETLEDDEYRKYHSK